MSVARLLPLALVPFYSAFLFKATLRGPPLVKFTFADVYDYIVVGGGSAGAVVASRLSEDPGVSVLLLEAGGLPNFFLDVPLLAAEIQQTKFDWAYRTVPQEVSCFGLKNRQSLWPRGKVLGGSSVLNYMLYVRGNRRDYDRWERELGCLGWGWDSVLPYFLKSEDNRDPEIAFNGPLTVLGGVEGIGFLRTKYNAESDDWPDAEIHFVSSSPAADGGHTIRRVMGMTDELFNRVYKPYLNMDSFTMYPVLLRPKSRGWIKLRSADPNDHPVIDPRYLTELQDVLVLVEAMKQLIALGLSEPFRKFDAQIFTTDFPGCEAYAPYSDEHLACLARTYTATIYHPSGTCRMGDARDPTTVVDPQLRVLGVSGLRVVDASVFPDIPSGNTNAPVIMVAEKASDMIRKSRAFAWRPASLFGTHDWLWDR
ncbi:glucose dehydrogenase, putative [Ixodes scapularis]|uniref:Glucose dehydrogenase, putative n=1 Tax=Ixodes scapularis TaxID=6945 RepID=B7QMD1_IXOSC|nr:glucose dehydrogenase, putative [Ixodes scapularis]|eukprot:XP_002416336.1 glucose dehydrogenase, putative [Ixodes scapularis]